MQKRTKKTIWGDYSGKGALFLDKDLDADGRRGGAPLIASFSLIAPSSSGREVNR